MGRIVIDHRITVSRDDVVTTRDGHSRLGVAKPSRAAWVSKCSECGRGLIGRTRTISANDLLDHWLAEHELPRKDIGS